MKKIFFIAISLLAMIGMTACHTTEANYKASYDTAMAKKKEGVDSITMAKIEQENKAHTAIIAGDSVRLVRLFVNMIDGQRADLKEYGVVVAEFKQVFNARSLRDRINTANNTKQSVVVYGGPERKYFVIGKLFDNSNDAAQYLHDTEKKVKIKIPLAQPYILQIP